MMLTADPTTGGARAMTHQIHVPYRTKNDSFADVLCNLRALPNREDRAVTAELVLFLADSPHHHTADDLLGFLDRAEERGMTRKALDALRSRAGLKSIDDLERQQSWSLPRTVAPTRAIEPCAADGCEQIPRHPTTLLPISATCNRWWCAEHAHLAQPGDLDPVSNEMRVKPGGVTELVMPSYTPAPNLTPGVRPQDLERLTAEHAATQRHLNGLFAGAPSGAGDE